MVHLSRLRGKGEVQTKAVPCLPKLKTNNEGRTQNFDIDDREKVMKEELKYHIRPVTSPCRECTKRCIGCHSTCAEYKLYRADMDKKNAEQAEIQCAKNFAYDVKREIRRRYKKRRRGDDR